MNAKLTIQYDGTDYSGWQIQNNAPSIQQKITDAIEIITKEKVNLIGSGRTDSGVHALGQVANFKSNLELDCERIKYSLNAILPKNIAIINCEKVHDDFHARFDAVSRSYLYFFINNKSPFYMPYCNFMPTLFKMDFDKLNKISKVLLGEHDFTSLSKKNEIIENKKCVIHEINWRRGKEISIFHVRANRFLHGMVRTIIGTLLFTIQNGLNEEYLLDVIAQQNREAAAESVDSKGLFLYKVRYQ